MNLKEPEDEFIVNLVDTSDNDIKIFEGKSSLKVLHTVEPSLQTSKLSNYE